MSTLSINVPDDVREAAEQVVAAGRFATVGEYVAALIRQDQASLERHLIGRIDGGPSREMTDGDFDRIRSRLDDEVRRRRTP